MWYRNEIKFFAYVLVYVCDLGHQPKPINQLNIPSFCVQSLGNFTIPMADRALPLECGTTTIIQIDPNLRTGVALRHYDVVAST